MQIEKKLIQCSILAIAIGIATIVPLEYFVVADAQAAVVSANAQAAVEAKPWSNVDVSYAYCNPYFSAGNSTTSLYGASIGVVANFSLTSDALKNADARIEYYQFQVYSDQGPIVNLTYYIVQSKPDLVTFISGGGAIGFANGVTYSGTASNGGQAINDGAWDSPFTMGFVSDHIYNTTANNLPQAVTELRNAQKLYIDVSRQCTVTLNGNVTVTTPSSHEVLQHIELTKTPNGFVYGTYIDGTLPMPMEGISSSPAVPALQWSTTAPSN